MNVPRTRVGAVISVLTLMDHLNAPAMMALGWIQMEHPAMVCTPFLVPYFNMCLSSQYSYLVQR